MGSGTPRRLLTACLLALSSCTDTGTAPQHGLIANYSGIADPETRWNAYAVQDYTLLQSRDCFCVYGGRKYLINVRSGKIASIIDPSDGSPLAPEGWGSYLTIPGLFALVKSIDTSAVAQFHVSYDPRYGYPVNLYVDPHAQIADDEYGYETEIVQ